MMADPGPQLLVWLTIFHRLAAVENIRHNVRCEGCKREPICGLRYKCTRCQHYNLCQDCFWTGVTTDQHTNAHDVKEYSSSSKSHSRQFGHSLRKSFQFGKLTNTAPQVSSPTVVSSGFACADRSTVGQYPKRPPLGSIFEWNSAPESLLDTNGISRNGMRSSQPSISSPVEISGPFVSAPGIGPNSIIFRPQMPVSVIRSPLPHRRLQQLNPLFLSTPANAGNLQQTEISNSMTAPVPSIAFSSGIPENVFVPRGVPMQYAMNMRPEVSGPATNLQRNQLNPVASELDPRQPVVFTAGSTRFPTSEQVAVSYG
ncbi:hypothetical protein AHF37_12008 [Paragonimus kellicotti]|nr:hypothetical protein AHF37_12008 [Paragonimus kellicotti]